MRGQDGGRQKVRNMVIFKFQSVSTVSNSFPISFKLISKSSGKIAVKGELQFLPALFENQEPLRFLHFVELRVEKHSFPLNSDFATGF